MYVAGIFTVISPVWVGDLETRQKNLKSLCLGCDGAVAGRETWTQTSCRVLRSWWKGVNHYTGEGHQFTCNLGWELRLHPSQGLILPFISWDFCFRAVGYSAKKIKNLKLGKKKLIGIASMFTYLALKDFLEFCIFTLCKIRFCTV